MTNLSQLKAWAEMGAAKRHHNLGNWADFRNNQVSINACTKCGMGVRVDTQPAPNDIDISGEAVALECDA